VIDGKLNEGIDFEAAEQGVQEVISKILEGNTTAQQLQKVKNQAFSTLVFGEMELLNRAMSLAFAENIQDASMANDEYNKLERVQLDTFNEVATEILQEHNCSTLYYDTEQLQ
ncbi:MAG TPA: hypothetical protein VL947_07540, partial [Cytophagales bacterium]|nr:hypothetical protein [Cytophagales bacterium]